jgi:LemA protein
MKRSGLIIIGIIAVLVLWAVSGQRGFVTLDEGVKSKWAGVQTAYQNRADLVKQLIGVVQGAKDFEAKTLKDVIEARAKATSVNIDAKDLTPENLEKFQQAQAQLSGAFSRLMAVAEQYPQLKATEAFLKLQGQVEGIENGVKSARDTFNASIDPYNVKVRQFPSSILASVFGFKEKKRFEADPGATNAPDINFK